MRRLLRAGSEGTRCSGVRSCGRSLAAGCRMPGHWQPQCPPATDKTSDSRLELCAAADAPGRPHSPAPRRRCRASQSRTRRIRRWPDLPRGSRSALPRGEARIHSRARAWASARRPRDGRSAGGLTMGWVMIFWSLDAIVTDGLPALCLVLGFSRRPPARTNLTGENEETTKTGGATAKKLQLSTG